MKDSKFCPNCGSSLEVKDKPSFLMILACISLPLIGLIFYFFHKDESKHSGTYLGYSIGAMIVYYLLTYM